MKNLSCKFFFPSLIFLAALTIMAAITPAQRNAKERQKDINDATKTASNAVKVFNEIMAAPDKGIPTDLLDKAEAIAIFPGVINAGFVFGARGGTGVISRRTSTGWSAPAFFKIGGGSFGAQIGAQSIDLVMLVMNDRGLQGLLEDKFEMGGEVSVAAGPVGRQTSATTNTTLDAEILSYSRTKGLFAGLSLKGTVINPDNNKNQSIYKLDAREILTMNSNKITMPANVKSVPQILNRYSHRKGK